MHYGASYGYIPFTSNIIRSIRKYDSMAADAIFAKSLSKFENALSTTHSTICGQDPIRIFLAMCAKSAKVDTMLPLAKSVGRLASYYTSAQMMRARTRNHQIVVPKLLMTVPDAEAATSVSYVSIVFSHVQLDEQQEEHRLTGFEKMSLLRFARDTVESKIAKKPAAEMDPLRPIISPAMAVPLGAFVTLKKHGELRGCIGQVLPTGSPLVSVVGKMAERAAFADRRFAPVVVSELKEIVFHISVLAAPHSIATTDEIVLGRDGIILQVPSPRTSALFLPSVPTEQKWDLATTMHHLSLKAGLDGDAWRRKDAVLQIFSSVDMGEVTDCNGLAFHLDSLDVGICPEKNNEF